MPAMNPVPFMLQGSQVRMAAATAARKGRRSGTRREESEVKGGGVKGEMVPAFVTSLASNDEQKLRNLQRACLYRLSGMDAGILRRKPVLERLALELNMQRGLRLLFLCIFMFGIVIYASMVESQSTIRMGTLRTFRAMFDTEGLSAINTREALAEYLQFVSDQSKKLMPLSSDHFMGQGGEIRIVTGLSTYPPSTPYTLQVANSEVTHADFSPTSDLLPYCWISDALGEAGGRRFERPVAFSVIWASGTTAYSCAANIPVAPGV